MSNSDVRNTARSAFGRNRELIDLQCHNLVLRLAPLPGAWRMTSAVYALHGPRARLRRAHALADALEVWKHQ